MDVVDGSGAPPAPPPFSSGLREALDGSFGARRIRVGYVSSDFGKQHFQHFVINFPSFFYVFSAMFCVCLPVKR